MARGDTSATTNAPVTTPGVVKSPNSCWRFMQGSYCPEELCHYQHGPPLHGTRLPRRTASSYGRTACLYFAQGYCKYGEKCAFAHIPLVNGPQNVSRLLRNYFRTEILVNCQSDSQDAFTGKPGGGNAGDLWVPSPTQNSNDVNSDLPGPPHQDATSWVHVETFEPPPGYTMMTQGRPVIWNGQDDGDEMENTPGSMQYLDKSRSRQVYDDKKVLVLSGGVMLGRPDQPHTPSPPASTPSVSTIRPTQPLQIVPLPIVPTGAAPSLRSSASSFSSGEYLPSPIEAYEAPMVPSFVQTPPPVQWAFGFPPQHTTITMKPVRPPTSYHRSKRQRHAQPTPSDPPSPPLEVDLASKLSTLQLDPPAKSDGYASDQGTPTSNPDASRKSSPFPSPAAPFRRSSLGAVAELDGKRRDIGEAILREPHATHRRGRPSM